MELEFDHHQWKLIFNAVRKQQQLQVVDSKWYREYDEILNALHPFAYTENYLDSPKERETY
ncbi:hypothetical protein [Cyanophage S-TIM5]|uniref:Uncharacterized protein n=1 Tax=Cyanophage S-TIM5 TaxID=1137745 RepID=H6WG51_9CAUD|nr:hypothetical protein F417_gp018 [Cyanophage S-TIM5]AEZ65597.1 hypothetical protein [Cyanophage S-TIM5]UYE96761.1 hypothetical protein [Cyanophage S-TIM66]UYE96974.1 hypothetical protein [Cyanophage S-TIM61]